MDLMAADEGASWHPLTSMITFESHARERVKYLYPILDGTSNFFSTLLHEVTHLMTARFGRFGVRLSRIGAREFLRWKKDPNLTLALQEGERNLLGAYLPLLEGLALYSQLDFCADEEDGPHYSPLFSAASLSIQIKTFQYPWSLKFDEWRRRADGGAGVPLLKALLLDPAREDLNFYFAGYLYIKSLQAHWAIRCPAFAEPAVFLPFAVKLIADHPVLLRAEEELMSVEEIVGSIHKTLAGFSAEELNWLADLFSPRRERFEFDHCAIYDQLASRPKTEIVIYHEQYYGQLIYTDEERMTMMSVFRGCNAVYLYSWCAGTLRLEKRQPSHPNHSYLDYDLTLEGPGSKTKIVIGPHAQTWWKSWDELQQTQADSETRLLMTSVAQHLKEEEKSFFRELSKYEGRDVCLAGFKTLFRSYPGVALWADGKLIKYFFSDPWDMYHSLFDNPALERMFFDVGLQIPPTERVDFAKALTDGEQVRRRARAAGEFMISLLAGRPTGRRALRQRLWMVWRDCRKDAIDWATQFPNQAQPPASLLNSARSVFDFPGFPADANGRRIDFQMLLPTEFKHRRHTA